MQTKSSYYTRFILFPSNYFKGFYYVEGTQLIVVVYIENTKKKEDKNIHCEE